MTGRLVQPRRRRLDALAVLTPAVVGLALCLFEIRTRSLWLDEAATVSIASQHGGAFGAALARDGGNMLGYYALMHLWIGAFGSGPTVIRLPSALAGGLTAACASAIALRLWGRWAALTAGLLVAVSLSLVYWGQTARAYAPMMALVAGSFMAFVWLLDGERGGALRWITYVVLTTAAVYAGLEAALVIPAQLTVLVWHRRRVRAALAGAAASALCCVPLAVLAAQRGSGQIFWIPPPSLRTAKQVLQALTSSGLQPAFYNSAGNALLILSLVLIAGCVVQLTAVLRGGWASRARQGGARQPDATAWGAVLVVSWLLVPLVLIVVLSLLAHSIFQARYVLVSLPAVSLAIAWALHTAPIPRLAATGILAALLSLRVLGLAPSYGVSTEYWRGATSYVAERSRTGDCLAFYPLDARMPFEYYGGRPAQLPPSVLPRVRWGVVRPYVERYVTLSGRALATLPARCARVWLVWSHEGSLGGPPVSGANFRRLQSLRRALELRYRHSTRSTFGRASPVVALLLWR